MDEYQRGLDDACKVMCASCDIGWEVQWSHDHYLHVIPKVDQDDSGRTYSPCFATKIRQLMRSHSQV